MKNFLKTIKIDETLFRKCHNGRWGVRSGVFVILSSPEVSQTLPKFFPDHPIPPWCALDPISDENQRHIEAKHVFCMETIGFIQRRSCLHEKHGFLQRSNYEAILFYRGHILIHLSFMQSNALWHWNRYILRGVHVSLQ